MIIICCSPIYNIVKHSSDVILKEDHVVSL